MLTAQNAVAQHHLTFEQAIALLDKAASILNDATLSEDGIDGDEALSLIHAIREAYATIGKTTTEQTNDVLFETLRELAGIPEDDEFTLLQAKEAIEARFAVSRHL